MSDEEDRQAWVQDDDAWNAFGKRTRIRQPKEDEDDEENAYLEGEAAFQRYVECLQWLLCTQARWLVHNKGMPADLEVVVRDLWHIRLRTLSWMHNRANTPPIRPLDTLVLCYFGLVILQLPTPLHDLYSWLSFPAYPPPPPLQQPSTTTTAANNLPTTTTAADDAQSTATATASAPTVPTAPIAATPRPSPPFDHLLYYLARDRAPAYLLHRLPGTYLNALMPGELTPARLQAGILALARVYRARLGISFPPLNFAPLAYAGYVDALRLPLEALPVVEKLARGAGVGWGFPGEGEGEDVEGEGEGEEGTRGKRKRGREKVDGRCWLPEAQLAALVVLAVETLCPFWEGEGNKVAAFEWGQWVEERKRDRERAAVEEGQMAVVGRVGSGDGDTAEPDEYLIAAEKMLQGHNVDAPLGLPKAAAPLGAADGSDAEEDEEEVDGLEGNQRVFYKAVARQAVMPVGLLVKSVALIEMKLEQSAKKIREGKKRSGKVR